MCGGRAWPAPCTWGCWGRAEGASLLPLPPGAARNGRVCLSQGWAQAWLALPWELAGAGEAGARVSDALKAKGNGPHPPRTVTFCKGQWEGEWDDQGPGAWSLRRPHADVAVGVMGGGPPLVLGGSSLATAVVSP